MSPTTHDLSPRYLIDLIPWWIHFLEDGHEILVVSKMGINTAEGLVKKFSYALKNPHGGRIRFRVTVGTLDPKKSVWWEPGAPPPTARVEALKILHRRPQPWKPAKVGDSVVGVYVAAKHITFRPLEAGKPGRPGMSIVLKCLTGQGRLAIILGEAQAQEAPPDLIPGDVVACRLAELIKTQFPAPFKVYEWAVTRKPREVVDESTGEIYDGKETSVSGGE